MGRCRHLLPMLLLGLAAGCITEQSARRGAGAAPGPQPPIGPDGVVLDVVLLERPVGDRYLNGPLWGCTDEHAVPTEQKVLLEDNGFRVGRLVGATPRELQKLLTSERYCVTHWRQILPAGKSLTLAIGRPVAEIRYQLAQESEAVLGKAQSFLVMVPTLTADGRTRLRFTPEIRYGDTLPEYQVAPDRSDYVLTYRQPRKTYPSLSWEVTLAPNEYVLVGAAFDRPQSLGYQCFIQEDDESAGQRLLVIRTGRSTAEVREEPAPASPEAAASTSLSPPLALQASWATARGSPP
jgi:hypothetical protein